MMRRSRRRATPIDAGFTLAEVVTASALLLMLIAMVTTTAILAMRTMTGLEVRLDNSTQGETAIAAAGKVLRTAMLPEQLEFLEQDCDGCADTAIVKATTTRVSFYANLNNTGQGPSLVTLETFDDTSTPGTKILRQTIQPPRPLADGRYTFCNAQADATCTVNTRTLARGLVVPSAGVFTYYDFSGQKITGTTVAADYLTRIASVDVRLTVQSLSGQTDIPTATTVQRVRLPNAELGCLTTNQSTTTTASAAPCW